MSTPPDRDKIIERLKYGIQNFDQIKGETRSEQKTKANVITPILEALGWPSHRHNDDDPWLDHKPDANDSGEVDYSALIGGEPYLLVEAKPLGTNLDRTVTRNGVEESPVKQIQRYAQETNPPLACVTNGLEWRMFLPGSRGSFPTERLFCTIALHPGSSDEEIDAAAGILIEYLVVPGKSDASQPPLKAVEASETLRRQRDFETALLNDEKDFVEDIRQDFASVRSIQEMTDIDILKLLINHLQTQLDGDTTTERTTPVPASSNKTKPSQTIINFTWNNDDVSTGSNAAALEQLLNLVLEKHGPDDFGNKMKGLDAFVTSDLRRIQKWDDKNRRSLQLNSSDYKVNVHAGFEEIRRRMKRVCEAVDVKLEDLNILVEDQDGVVRDQDGNEIRMATRMSEGKQ